MLHLLSFVAGAAMVIGAVADAVWTVLWTERAGGPLSSRLIASVWRRCLASFSGHHTALSLVGPVSVALVLLLWIALVWAGWFLIFSTSDTSVVDAVTGAPGTAVDRLYYAGYTIFTLGNGDMAPNGPSWQIATVLATANGLVLITLGITYLVSVLGALVGKRAFASRVNGLGQSPEQFVVAAWDGRSFAGLDLVLNSLAVDLNRLSTQHLAYPVIHYFHSAVRAQSTAVAVAVLDEAVMLLRLGVAPEARPSHAVLASVASAVSAYLDTLTGGDVSPADTAPPPPSLDVVGRNGVPIVEDATYAGSVGAADDRRRRLRGLVDSDGWTW